MKFNGVKQISVLKIYMPSIPEVYMVHGSMGGQKMQLSMEGEKEEEATPNINPKILKCPVIFVIKHGESFQKYVSKR